jgi:2-octaprenyl-6-methoxyphenol hydroxylase
LLEQALYIGILEMKQKNYDIAIIGGGLVGSVAALNLAKFGYKIVMIDKAPQPKMSKRNDKRAFAISLGSKKFLEKEGLWSIFNDTDYSPIKNIHVIEGMEENYLEFDYKELSNEPLGYMMFADVILKKITQKVLENNHIDVHYESSFRELNIEENQAHFKINGDDVSADLLIAADGRSSTVKKLLEQKTKKHDYHQVALTGTIEHDNHHNFIALERFLSNGPFAILPLHGGQHSSIVWADSKKNMEYFLSLSKDDLLKEVKKRAGKYFKNAKFAEDLQSYPLNLIYSKNNVAPRTIIIGDAAHGIHPLTGQGFNLAVRDVKELVRLISDNRFKEEKIGNSDFINEFYKNRKLDIFSIIFLTHNINRVFTSKNPLIKFGRKMALKVADKIPVAKKIMMMKGAC